MAKTPRVNSLSELLSLSNLLTSLKPKEAIREGLIKLLKLKLRSLGIIWNPTVFRSALSNPELPAWLLKKLENLILLAEASDWKISPELKMELDNTVEDIESFNPSYRAWAKKEREKFEKELKAGRLKTYSLEEIKRKIRKSK